jgi:hypothetical protein
MTEQNIPTHPTALSSLAEHAAASGAWWHESALDQPNAMALPPRVLHRLDKAGIHTVEQLKAAGPHKLRNLDGIGKLAFDQIIELLRALDRQANGGDS